ncbi:isopeptide-forming domain-containing fimbrial protein [Streptomyces sp. NPDC127068]|uniref:isopeptide-forming domain-containing fimbrial protein n=1 Tax=Streptomyces sp. NPDC127068 TaxID=3347127 RepID=UPI0036670B8B
MTTPPSTPLRVALVNGGFEEPVLNATFEYLPDSTQSQARKVPGWITTATDHLIELWRSGHNGVPSAVGSQFAELNAYQVSTLYQDLPTTPGTKLYWRLYHRGRAGTDVMALDIGAPGAVVQQRTFSDGNTAWGFYTGTYTVPAGQTLTRFAFRSVSSVGGATSGNFLDGVFFGTAPVVVLEKTVSPAGPVEVGSVLTYRVKATNTGGDAAEALVLTDAVPAGATFVPGSLRIVDGPNAGAKTDQSGDDQANFDATDNKVVFRLGTGASATQGGALANTAALPAGTTVEYKVTVNAASGGGRIANTASATYENRLAAPPEQLTATSNQTSVEVRPAADLTVTKAADATTVTVGQTVTYRITVRNTGPNPATGVTVTDQLPASLVFLSAESSTGAYDPATGRWAVGALAHGATATLTLRAKATAPGRVTHTATVTGSESDPDQADNSDSVIVCVTAAPVCAAQA